jgi:hypothetical protein
MYQVQARRLDHAGSAYHDACATLAEVDTGRVEVWSLMESFEDDTGGQRH